MTGKAYKDYERVDVAMPQFPWVLKGVDTKTGTIYINTCAAPDANMVMLLTEYYFDTYRPFLKS